MKNTRRNNDWPGTLLALCTALLLVGGLAFWARSDQVTSGGGTSIDAAACVTTTTDSLCDRAAKLSTADLGAALTSDSALDRLLRKSVLAGTETADSAGRILFQLFQQATAAAPVTDSMADRIISGITTAPDPIVFSVIGPESLGVHLAVAGVSGSTYTWPTTNRGFYIPVRFNAAQTIEAMAIANGNVVSGNFKIGMYKANGTGGIPGDKITVSDAITNTGADAYQATAVTIAVPAGVNYFFIVFNNNIVQYLGVAPLSAVPQLGFQGVFQEDTVYTAPPDTATPVKTTLLRVPVVAAARYAAF